jgi:hypothetical protein
VQSSCGSYLLAPDRGLFFVRGSCPTFPGRLAKKRTKKDKQQNARAAGSQPRGSRLIEISSRGSA